MIRDRIGEPKGSGPIIAFVFFLLLLFFTVNLWLQNSADENAAKAAIVILIGALSVFYSVQRRKLLSLIAFTLPFPIYLQIAGRDAFTLTSFLIFMLLAMHLDVLPRTVRIVKESYGPALALTTVLFLIILVTFVSTSGGSLGPNLRRLFSEGASFGIFVLCGAVIEDLESLEKLLRVLIVAFLVQACVVSLQVMLPGVAIPVGIFSPRDNPDFVRILNDMSRAGGTLGDYELLAQWFAILIPFAVYFLLSDKKHFVSRLFVIVGFLAGIVMTGTRGALISVSIGLLVFLWIILRNERGAGKLLKRSIEVAFVLALVVGTLLVSFPERASEYWGRFTEAVWSYQSGADLSAVANRGSVWANAINTIGSPSLLGNGPNRLFSFHSLYLTVIYEVGIVGVAAFLGFLLYVIRRCYKSLGARSQSDEYVLLAASFASLLILLVDEIKVEFLRYSSTSELAWMLFGIALVSARLHKRSVAQKLSENRSSP